MSFLHQAIDVHIHLLGANTVLHISAATPSQVLQQAKMQIMPFDVCRAGHSNFHEGMLCAGYDSGYVSSCLVR